MIILLRSTVLYIRTHTHSQPSEIQLLGDAARNNPRPGTVRWYLFLSGVTDSRSENGCEALSQNKAPGRFALSSRDVTASHPRTTNTAPYLLLNQGGNNPWWGGSMLCAINQVCLEALFLDKETPALIYKKRCEGVTGISPVPRGGR